MSDMKKTPRKRLTSDQKRIKELENQINILHFKLKQVEIEKLPPMDAWAADALNKVLVDKLRKQSDEQRLVTIKQFFGEIKSEEQI